MFTGGVYMPQNNMGMYGMQPGMMQGQVNNMQYQQPPQNMIPGMQVRSVE